MANIFVNSFNATNGGGKNILDNYIYQLSLNKSSHNYYILTPDYEKYSLFSDDKITIVDISNIYKKQLFFPILYFCKFPQILRKLNIDLIINFGDVIIPSNISQIYYFDWAYAVYESKLIWEKMNFKSYLTRKIKLFLIKKYVQNVSLIFAQTEIIKSRIKSKLNFHNIRVLCTPVGLDFSKKNIKKKSFNLPKYNRIFIYPASFSVHKNFDVITSVGKLIDSKNLPFTIVLTLNKNDASKYLFQIKNIKSVVNISTVNIDDMPSLYEQCDALLFPSLLESYGLPLIEAMAFEKPILVSDLDFAHSVCGESAFYFDPLNPNSIIEVMNSYHLNVIELNRKIAAGKVIANKIPNWMDVFLSIETEINTTLNINYD